MKKYNVSIILRDIQADDEEHVLEQVEEMLADKQYSPDVREVGDTPYFLCRFEITDGEHEHYDCFTVRAKDLDEAFKIAESQEHDPFNDPGNTYWSYGGDGTTAAKVDSVTQVTPEEAETLRLHGASFIYSTSELEVNNAE